MMNETVDDDVWNGKKKKEEDDNENYMIGMSITTPIKTIIIGLT